MSHEDGFTAVASNSENVPLLPSHSICDDENSVSTMTIVWEELIKLLKFTAPSFASQLARHSLAFVSVISVGHISRDALSASSLAGTTAAVTGICVLGGLASALDKWLPQAWTSPHPHLMGLAVQRVAFIAILLTFPIGLIWFNSAGIFSLISNQNKEVIQLAALNLRFLYIGLPSYGYNQICRKYFNAQKLIGLQSRIEFFMAFVNIICNYLLVWGPRPIRLGFIGAPLSTAISSTSASIISTIYGFLYMDRKSWHSLSCHMFTNLGEVIRFGFYGIVQVASRMWAWEIMTLCASTYDSITLASQSILIRTTSALSADAVGTAASTSIGNLIGEKKPRRAKISCFLAIILGFFVNSVTCITLLLLRNKWSYIFNNDSEVAYTVANSLPFAVMYLLGDGIASVTTSILGVKGNQSTAAAINISGFYLLGLPLGYYLTFYRDMGLDGLWITAAVAIFFNAIIGVYFCITTDWITTVENASKHMKKEAIISS